MRRYLHEDEAGEAGSAVGDPLVPCNGLQEQEREVNSRGGE